MATHEQTYLGPIIEGLLEELEADGVIQITGYVNSYYIAAELCREAGGIGIVINADAACDTCREEERAARYGFGPP